jgi:hypothetical protein
MKIVGLKDLCLPSQIYLVVSLIALVAMAFQNTGNTHLYCVGAYKCDVSVSVYLIFILKFLYVIFWTWVLNIICRAGKPIVSWILLFMPIILFFIFVILVMV